MLVDLAACEFIDSRGVEVLLEPSAVAPSKAAPAPAPRGRRPGAPRPRGNRSEAESGIVIAEDQRRDDGRAPPPLPTAASGHAQPDRGLRSAWPEGVRAAGLELRRLRRDASPGDGSQRPAAQKPPAPRARRGPPPQEIASGALQGHLLLGSRRGRGRLARRPGHLSVSRRAQRSWARQALATTSRSMPVSRGQALMGVRAAIEAAGGDAASLEITRVDASESRSWRQRP